MNLGDVDAVKRHLPEDHGEQPRFVEVGRDGDHRPHGLGGVRRTAGHLVAREQQKLGEIRLSVALVGNVERDDRHPGVLQRRFTGDGATRPASGHDGGGIGRAGHVFEGRVGKMLPQEIRALRQRLGVRKNERVRVRPAADGERNRHPARIGDAQTVFHDQIETFLDQALQEIVVGQYA